MSRGCASSIASASASSAASTSPGDPERVAELPQQLRARVDGRAGSSARLRRSREKAAAASPRAAARKPACPSSSPARSASPSSGSPTSTWQRCALLEVVADELVLRLPLLQPGGEALAGAARGSPSGARRRPHRGSGRAGSGRRRHRSRPRPGARRAARARAGGASHRPPGAPPSRELDDRVAPELAARRDRRALEDGGSPAGSRSSRAARSAWIVGGGRSIVAAAREHRATSCSRKSGFPSAASTARSRAPGGSGHSASSSSSSAADSASLSASSVSRAPPQRGRSSRARGARGSSSTGASPAPADEVLEQVEERRFRPVRVLEAGDDRPLAGERFQQAPHGPERLLVRDGLRRRAQDAAQTLGDLTAVGLAGDRPFHGPVAAGGADEVGERQEVIRCRRGRAACGQDGRSLTRLGEQLRGEPGLADPGRAEHRHQAARPLPARPARARCAGRRARRGADEPGVEPPREGRRVRDRRHHAPRRHRRRFPSRAPAAPPPARRRSRPAAASRRRSG